MADTTKAHLCVSKAETKFDWEAESHSEYISIKISAHWVYKWPCGSGFRPTREINILGSSKVILGRLSHGRITIAWLASHKYTHSLDVVFIWTVLMN